MESVAVREGDRMEWSPLLQGFRKESWYWEEEKMGEARTKMTS